MEKENSQTGRGNRTHDVTKAGHNPIPNLQEHDENNDRCSCCCKHCPKLSIRWVIMFALGLVIGIVGMFVHQSTHFLSHKIKAVIIALIQRGEWQAFGVILGISSALLFGAVLLVAIWPDAGGSGIPEVMGVLNKSLDPHSMKNGRGITKTFFAKLFSCICAVTSGLPVGPESPMIHMGGLIGAGFGKCHSFRCKECDCLKELETRDRQTLISAGVAAGVASAIGAPIGGLLFSMEEMSSSWSSELTWKTFFCCTVASFTSKFFNSFLNGFEWQRAPGLFEIDTKFQVDYDIATHILTFIPALILGCLGGVFGCAFIVFNKYIRKCRKRTFEKCIKKCDEISNTFCKLLCKVLVCFSEPFLMLLFKFHLEITNDTSFLLLLMTAVITSKLVGDCIYKKSLYHDILHEITPLRSQLSVADDTKSKKLQDRKISLTDTP
ncbi:unnamed protein product [Clavelina lepadiformis]|uniref:Chloride channel protein n=1 Tax=Clavelina lepadiformis TaxID=159417 RepID=A0ABP0GBH5_CLALP